MELSWELTEDPTRFDLDAVDAGLAGFNLEQGGIDEVRRLAVLVRDASDVTVGGVIGRTWGKCCHVQVLWLREDFRGKGVGGKLLAMAEQEAARRGCTLVHLDTFSFQAPDFYKRQGYEEFHAIPGFPRGITKHFFHKALA
jgi:GNAT superfamily N-acetyltransferase